MHKHILFLLLNFLFTCIANASHLLGGTISHKLVFTKSSKVTYLITVETYIDCQVGKTSLDDVIYLGIYTNDSQKTLYKSVSVNLTKLKKIDVPCSPIYTYCVQSGTYTSLVELDTNSTGYLIISSRCCRGIHGNLIAEKSGSSLISDGFTFLSNISSTQIKNNSPQFNFNPKLLNNITVNNEDKWGAIDSDGDSLIYEIVAPYSGGSSIAPKPEPPLNYTYPSSVKYKPGYSYLKPFGNDGTISIHRFTGNLNFSNKVTGVYAFSIEIKEFRKGKLIGIYRRDYPLIFANLPSNQPDYSVTLKKPIYYSSGYAHLSWDICPIDSANITIQRKEKNTNWKDITTFKNYTNYQDSIITDTWYYYRIKAELDGKIGYSNIDSANFRFIKGSVKNIEREQILMFPNPSKEYIGFKNQSFKFYTIYEISGKQIQESKAINNGSEIKIDIRHLKPGLYFITLYTDNTSISQRFVKE